MDLEVPLSHASGWFRTLEFKVDLFDFRSNTYPRLKILASLEFFKHIWLVGGSELVAAFLDSEQVDEFIIHVIPTMIGEGIPLVAPRHRNLPLKLLASKTFPDGVVGLHYAVRKNLHT